jgi:hypothetical protein
VLKAVHGVIKEQCKILKYCYFLQVLQDRGFQGKERDVTSTVAWTGLSPDVYLVQLI